MVVLLASSGASPLPTRMLQQQLWPHHNRRVHVGNTPWAPVSSGQVALYLWAPQDISQIRPLRQVWERLLIYLILRNKHSELGKMRGQKSTFLTKNQDKTPEKELNKTEMSNLPDKEFKVMVTEFRRRNGWRGSTVWWWLVTRFVVVITL